MQARIIEKEEEIEILHDQLTEILDEKDKTDQQMQEMDLEHENERWEHNEELQEKDKEINDLECKVDDLEEENDEQYDIIETEIPELKQQILSLNKKQARTNQQLLTLKREQREQAQTNQKLLTLLRKYRRRSMEEGPNLQQRQRSMVVEKDDDKGGVDMEEASTESNPDIDFPVHSQTSERKDQDEDDESDDEPKDVDTNRIETKNRLLVVGENHSPDGVVGGPSWTSTNRQDQSNAMEGTGHYDDNDFETPFSEFANPPNDELDFPDGDDGNDFETTVSDVSNPTNDELHLPDGDDGNDFETRASDVSNPTNDELHLPDGDEGTDDDAEEEEEENEVADEQLINQQQHPESVEHQIHSLAQLVGELQVCFDKLQRSLGETGTSGEIAQHVGQLQACVDRLQQGRSDTGGGHDGGRDKGILPRQDEDDQDYGDDDGSEHLTYDHSLGSAS